MLDALVTLARCIRIGGLAFGASVLFGVGAGCGGDGASAAQSTGGTGAVDAGSGADAQVDAWAQPDSAGDAGIVLPPLTRPLWLGYFKVAGRYGDHTLEATSNAGNCACVFANHGDFDTATQDPIALTAKAAADLATLDAGIVIAGAPAEILAAAPYWSQVVTLYVTGEATGSAALDPTPCEQQATVARKGRTPTLRERYDALSGNPELAPELATLGEVRLVATPRDGVALELSPYWRRSTGTVVAGADGRLTNLGTTDVRGVDASARARVPGTGDALELGGSYQLTAARARNAPGDPWRDDPLDFLPRHRGDAWARVAPHAALALVARVRHGGASIDRMQPVPASTLVDLSASATLGGDWLAVVRCDDLLDERPEVRSNVRGPGRVLSLIVQGTWD